jgi:hypothetical protein
MKSVYCFSIRMRHSCVVSLSFWFRASKNKSLEIVIFQKETFTSKEKGEGEKRMRKRRKKKKKKP